MIASTAISEKRTWASQANGGCLIAFGSLFFLVGLIAVYFTVVRPIWRVWDSQSWVAHPAEITFSRVEESHDDDGTSYQPVVHFRYELDGQAFDGREWSYAMHWSTQRWAEEIVARYPIGSQHTCYYDPDDPAQAVLDRSYGSPLSSFLFCAIFMSIGGAVMYAGYRSIPSRESATGSMAQRALASAGFPQSAAAGFGSRAGPGGAQSPEAELAEDIDDLESEQAELAQEPPPWEGHEGPGTLKPAISRRAVFIGVMGFSLIWNTITWIAFINVIQGGWFSFLALFMLVFVVVGFGSFVYAIYSFLKLFNPNVTLAVSNLAATPGETLDIAWELEGRHQRISQLTLSWVGQEVATYTRGTDTTTEYHEFARLPIASVSDTEQIRFHSVSFTVPANAMHSFRAPRNRISWTIEVRGSIAWWPDIHESMVVYVKPREQ